MIREFDRNLFTQTGLDSGSLTMLGAVIHSFREPGEYRGSVRHNGKETKAVFYISADRESPVAQVNIDLAALTNPPDPSTKGGEREGVQNRFTVNPKGYALFHVSQGAGGYDVHVRKAGEKPDESIFDSRKLSEGDIFSAIIIRPGLYSVVNLHTKAKGEVVVSYPEIGKAPYRPPGPLRVKVTRESFEPRQIKLKPGQAVLFECGAPSQIKIELEKPDDGPGSPPPSKPRGWKKMKLPEMDTHHGNGSRAE
jgi:hypothetical protein